MAKEIWRPVPGYEGYYEVSSTGRVYSIGETARRRVNGRILKQGTDRYGYKTVILCVNKSHKTKRVHRLVADAFVPMVNGKKFVDHIDANKANNNYKNLRWVTKSENSRNVNTQKQLSALRDPGSKTVLRKIPVCQYSIDGIMLRRFESINEATRELGLSKSGIRYATIRGNGVYGGFLWSLVETDKEK